MLDVSYKFDTGYKNSALILLRLLLIAYNILCTGCVFFCAVFVLLFVYGQIAEFFVCIWHHNLSMGAILVDNSTSFSAITANKLGYFAISWCILKCPMHYWHFQKKRACLIPLTLVLLCTCFELSTKVKMAANIRSGKKNQIPTRTSQK